MLWLRCLMFERYTYMSSDFLSLFSPGKKKKEKIVSFHNLCIFFFFTFLLLPSFFLRFSVL
jgi:hypothetical protein